MSYRFSKYTTEQEKIFIDKAYNWIFLSNDNSSCSFKGWFRFKNTVYKGPKAVEKIVEMFTDETDIRDISKIVNTLEGDFGFIVVARHQIIASVDKKRSYPVFYAIRGEECYVGNSARYLQKKINLYEKDHDSILEFKMAGYVMGPRTVFKDLYQLQAGELLVYNKSQKLKVVRYFSYFMEGISSGSEKQLKDELYEITNEMFRRMIERLDGRPVWIPLSAGYDSRLILCMLKKHKYDNLNCFFYGGPGNANWERKYSHDLAEKLNVPWRHISYSYQSVRDVYKSKVWMEYGVYADGLCSLPAYSYIFYMERLIKNKLLSPDAIIINGQSGDFISGNHLFESLFNLSTSRRLIDKAIIDKHFSLWLNLKTSNNLELIKTRINEVVKEIELDPDSSQSVANMLDYWEWNERQCKYVVNGQRAYDYFGINWELPLWDDAYLRFWKRIPWNMKINQKLFREFLEEINLFGAFKGYKPNRSLPLTLQAIKVLFTSFTRIFPQRKREQLVRKYLSYIIYPNNYYAIIPYLEYLKTSENHRSVASYFCQKHLQNLGVN